MIQSSLHPGRTRHCLIAAVLLLPALQAGNAAAEQPLPVGSFEPIPVLSIYPPLKPQGTADEALVSGRVVSGNFAMTGRASKPWRIAYLFPHIKDPYWIGCSYGVIGQARRLGISADIFPADGYNDLVGQLRKMDEVIAAKYDAIVISPISLTANNASIAKARAAGIPVFELANDSTSDDLTVKVTTSLKSMGLDATRWVIRDAQQRGLKSVNIALLPGPAGTGWVKGEVDGTREAAQTAPLPVKIVDIRYGDSDRIEQSQLAARMLAEHGSKIDYIIGCTGCAPAARLPLQEAGLSETVRIVAYDLTREIAGLIRKRELYAAADTKGVSQARVVTNVAVSHLEGRGKTLPHTILIQLGLADRANYRSYKLDTSIPPEGYAPILSYRPDKRR